MEVTKELELIIEGASRKRRRELPRVHDSADSSSNIIEPVIPFAGANEEFEIESYDEFLRKSERELVRLGEGASLEDISFDGWVFQSVDFRALPADVWHRYNFLGAYFWGCILPADISVASMRDKGVEVLENPTELPFKPFRAFLYRLEELAEMDVPTYRYYLKHENKGVRAAMLMAVHDHSIRDALYDYLEGKTMVVIMGGHGMKRGSEDYVQVTTLGWMLAKEGFIVATGGGPGAMEAANLGCNVGSFVIRPNLQGAYLHGHGIGAVDRVMDIFGSFGDSARGYADAKFGEGADAVLKEFGLPTWKPSLGIPTWKYGHEPPNKFATYHAKMFSNAVREDGLVQIGNAGIIYTPGRAGTRQEIFQAACKNHYAEEGADSPMVFWKSYFWSNGNNEYFDLLKRSAADHPYSKWLLCTDSLEEIVGHVVEFRRQRKLPIVTRKDLEGNHWMKDC